MSYGYNPLDQYAYDLSVIIKKWAFRFLNYGGPLFKFFIKRWLSMGRPVDDPQLVDRIYREAMRFDKQKEKRLAQIADKNEREGADKKRQLHLL